MRMRARIPIATTPTERRVRREARSETLRELALALRQDGWTYAHIGKALGVSLERARRVIKKAERLRDQPRWHDKLPVRALNFLLKHELESLPEIDAARAVALLSRRELLGFANLGVGTCAAVVAWLSHHGLKLQPPQSSRRLVAQCVAERDAAFPDHENEAGTPMGCPSVSNDPFSADRNDEQAPCLYPPPAT